MIKDIFNGLFVVLLIGLGLIAYVKTENRLAREIDENDIHCGGSVYCDIVQIEIINPSTFLILTKDNNYAILKTKRVEIIEHGAFQYLPPNKKGKEREKVEIKPWINYRIAEKTYTFNVKSLKDIKTRD